MLLLERIAQPAGLVGLGVVVKARLLRKALVAARNSAGVRSQLNIKGLSQVTFSLFLSWSLPVCVCACAGQQLPSVETLFRRHHTQMVSLQCVAAHELSDELPV